MSLADIFSSKSKFKIVAALSIRSTPIHLRALSELLGVPLRSVQLAVASLEELQVISRSSEMNQVSFVINRDNPYFSQLRELFLTSRNKEIEKRAQEYSIDRLLLSTVNELCNFNSKIEL